MDQGPVDAGPQLDREYEDPIRPVSPDGTRYESRKKSAFRNPSRRRDHGRSSSLAVPDDLTQAPTIVKHESSDGSSHHSLHDPPTYTRVGATAEEASGEVQSDYDEGMKEGRPAESNVSTPESTPGCNRVYKFTLYETSARYWITGADLAEKVYRLLRIDRTSPPGHIALFEDETTYSLQQMNEVLTSIDEGNKATGGLKKKYQFWGVLGFIRFTEAYYMLVITKRQQAAMIGGHYVYQIEGTELVPLTIGTSSLFVRDRNAEEIRFLGIFNNLDLHKSFYFSYSYDITNSLQCNIMRQRQAIYEEHHHANLEFNSMFVWNHHLLKPAIQALKHPFIWCLPIMHGFIDQVALDVFGRAIYITLIGRRSRFFAGARFLKRGVNDRGYVANDVETEQIVSDKVTTSFHAPGPRLFSSPNYTSFLHHRGSIPLYWTQDNSGVSPKPDINLNLLDPFYQPAALHFDNLFERYGCPVYVLNLIKARERTPRESKLLIEFQKCVEYLNQSLPADKRILYKAFDMSRASKTRGGDVIGSLETIAKDIVDKIGFFRNGDEDWDGCQVQNGVARTNCIDCLDRTNAAQFVLGKRAFALQLQALGVIDRDEVDFDTDAVNVFTHMFHDHGDTIAVQYGGSHLVNTMATYRKLNQWQSSSRDMVESFKRYYHNSFLDNQRQEAYNLFLGNYIWAAGQPMLWEMTTDYYLHHSDPRAWLEQKRRNYIHWYTPKFLDRRSLPPLPPHELRQGTVQGEVREFDDYWTETYRPTTLSTMGKVYSFRINSVNRFLPERPHRDSRHDISPFEIRVDPHRQLVDSPDKRAAAAPRKGVKILDPHEEPLEPGPPPPSSESGNRPPTRGEEIAGILREPTAGKTHPTPTVKLQGPVKPADKAQMHLWTLNQFHSQALNPSVSDQEEREYNRYVAHPLHLPLVVSTELPSDANIDYLDYVHKAGGAAYDDFGPEEGFMTDIGEHDLQQFSEFLVQREDPLTVTEEDGAKKRYKAYRQWMRGKSLFKQSKVDPEYKAGL